MNDVPPAKRADTQNPFAVMSPELGRGQTGTRVKITEISNDQPSQPEASFSPGVTPESLKKPFASLIPKKASPSLGPTPAAGNAPPPPPSQLFAETASMRPPGASQTSRTSIAPRREGSAPSRYGTCKEHGTALTSEGKCVLCAREQAKRSAKNASRTLVFLAIALIGAGAYFVLEVLPK
jgi:hypothetical protein